MLQVGMAYRLKSRAMQIPNGFRWLQPETNWKSARFASFDSIVKSLINHRLGRPDLVAKHEWRTDYEGVAFELEQFNIRLCLQHGWMDYLDGVEIGGGLPPKSRPPSQQEEEQVSAAGVKAKKIWSGVKLLNDWIDSGEPPVPEILATARAAVCAGCAKNSTGDFTSWFTKPAAGALKRQMEKLAERKLTTPSDSKINVCEVCLCPLKLKVHTPIKFIKDHMTETVANDLMRVEKCWIIDELKT